MMHRNSASDTPRRRDEITSYQAKRNGNTPAARGQRLRLALVKHSPMMLQTSMANTPFARNHADFIFIARTKAENSRRMPLACTICTATCGNCARTIGSMITHRLQEMAVSIRTKIAATTSSVVDHGMSHLRSVAVRRGSRFWGQMQRNLLGFGWFAIALRTMILHILKDNEWV